MNDRTRVHSTLLAYSARKALTPLGLIQKGRSRTWLADHGWWMVIVEFQPSSWEQGSHLNVGCMWLWNVKSDISFDEGYRCEPFHKYVNEKQFEQIGEELARKAVAEITRYRNLFPTIEAVSDYYLQKPPADSFWPSFNAAIAHGLSGRGKAGAYLLSSQIGRLDPAIQWQKDADTDARLMASEIENLDRFRQLISTRITRTRELRKLAPTTLFDFSQ